MPAPKQNGEEDNTDPAEGSRKVIERELERREQEPGQKRPGRNSDSEADERAR